MGTGSTATADVLELVDHAKHPASPVSGPYGHPFHPMLVTVPIGAWVCSVVFDVVSKSGADDAAALTTASYWLIGIGIVGAVLAALFGLMDLMRLPRGTAALRLGIMHMSLNLGVVGLFVVGFLWRRGSYEDPPVSTGQLLLSACALAVLSVSGWLGGMLAYRYGVRVAHETDQAEGYVRGSARDARTVS
jgi:uncharacterized membrane protein